MYHALKSEISPHDNFLSTTLITDIGDKYQVCHCYQWSTVLTQSARLYRVQNCAQCKIIQCKITQTAKCCRVQDCAEFKIMQSAKSYSAKLCKVQNVAGCKIVQSSKLCRVNNYAECEIVQCARFCCVQDCAECKVMQSKDYASVFFFQQQCLMLKISKTGWGSISFIKGHYATIV